MLYEIIGERQPGTSAIEYVLNTRGITEVEHYLNTNDSDILDPLLLDNMEQGAKMLVSHIARNSKVFIQIDSDCDGYTSAAALINYLNKIFPAFVQNNISYRPHTGKMHGLILDTIPEGVDLVIAPDSSSEDYEIHKTLKEKGIDILVLDHHKAEKVSEYACVINNQLCDYPTKSLSGVGVVFKFCSYLDSLLGTRHAEDILDLTALGLVADMVSLQDFETRHLITKGLKNVCNPYFKGMTIKNEFSLKGKITPFGVAFFIAPYINAVTRSGTMDEKIILFEAMLDFKAFEQIPSTKRGCKGQYESRVEQACRNCVNIKNRQTKARDASLEIIEKMIGENNLLNEKILIIKLSKAQKTTLAGLIANQLMAELQRPILVLNETTHDVLDEEGKVVDTEIWWEGSARVPEMPIVSECREYYDATGVVQYTQGHKGAFGFGIKDKDLPEFIRLMNEKLKDFDFTPTYKADFIINAQNIKYYHHDFYNLIEYENLWGQGVANPLIVVENIKIHKDNIQLFKGSTLKISFAGDPDIEAIKFRSSEQEYENLYSDSGCVTITIVGVCERNSFNDKPQIVIKDYAITDKCDFYF